MIRKILIAIGSTILAAGIMGVIAYLFCVIYSSFGFEGTVTTIMIIWMVLVLFMGAKIFYDIFTKD